MNTPVKRIVPAPLALALLVLGSPIWLSLLIAAFAVALSVYVSAWAVIVLLWAGFVSVAACALSGVLVGIIFAVGANGLAGVAMLGAGLVCAGFGILLFYGCKWATIGLAWLTKKTVQWIKNCFVKKEAA